LTVSPVAGGGDALARVQRENETLYAVIKTVSSSLDSRDHHRRDGLSRLLHLLPGR
jgi:hypothetical protein